MRRPSSADVNWISWLLIPFLLSVMALHWQSHSRLDAPAPASADLGTYWYHHHTFDQDTALPGPSLPAVRSIEDSRDLQP